MVECKRREKIASFVRYRIRVECTIGAGASNIWGRCQSHPRPMSTLHLTISSRFGSITVGGHRGRVAPQVYRVYETHSGIERSRHVQQVTDLWYAASKSVITLVEPAVVGLSSFIALFGVIHRDRTA